MNMVQVLLDEDGNVVGTARAGRPVGDGPTATLVPRQGQRVVEVELSDAERRLDAAGLLEVLRDRAR